MEILFDFTGCPVILFLWTKDVAYLQWLSWKNSLDYLLKALKLLLVLLLYLSSTKVPETKRKRSDNASVQSKVSRSTEASNSVRYRDENSCVFCGYADNAKRDTCHIFEISQYNAYNGDKKQMLLELGLDYINTMANMLALCVCCHREFDNRFIGIHPSARTLVISDAIRSKNTQGNIPFSQLHGKCTYIKITCAPSPY